MWAGGLAFPHPLWGSAIRWVRPDGASPTVGTARLVLLRPGSTGLQQHSNCLHLIFYINFSTVSEKSTDFCFICFSVPWHQKCITQPVLLFRIRIHRFRILIKLIRLNTNPDPGFWWPKIEIISNGKKIIISVIINCNSLIPRPP